MVTPSQALFRFEGKISRALDALVPMNKISSVASFRPVMAVVHLLVSSRSASNLRSGVLFECASLGARM